MVLNMETSTIQMNKKFIGIRAALVLGILILGVLIFFAQNKNPLETTKGSHHLININHDALSHPPSDDYIKNTLLNPDSEHEVPESLSNQTNDKMAADEEFVKNQLVQGMVPPNIHYMWCGERWFEFKHYLSFVSAIKTFRPNKIVLHYDIIPQVDTNLYNLWLEDLKRDFPYLILEKMENDLSLYCKGDRDGQIHAIMRLLNDEGGIYISENTYILEAPPQQRIVDFEIALEPSSLDGYMFMKGQVFDSAHHFLHILHDNKTYDSKSSGCRPIHQVYNNHVNSHCYIVKGGKFDRFWPMDIWELEDPFGRLIRKIFYGTEAVLHPKPSYKSLVPNIGHMVWIGGGPMDYVFYLSLLSMLFVAKVDVVYIHGDKSPTGPFWEKLETIDRIRQRIKCVKRTPPSMIYQGVIEPYYRALMSDIIRVDLMIKYGGVYTDTDAIWVKPLSLEERGYDAVACFDWVDWSYPYPDSVNFGVSYGKRNAPFWRLFRDSMRVLHNEHHGFTGVMNPYRLLEKQPQLLKIDKRLSVICYYSRCHPIWVEDYHNMTNDHVTEHSIPNWKEDVHAFHWTYPNPKEYANETTLLKSVGLFSDIGKFVLKSAGLI